MPIEGDQDWAETFTCATIDREIFIVKKFRRSPSAPKIKLTKCFLDVYKWSKFVWSSGHSNENKAKAGENLTDENIFLPRNSRSMVCDHLMCIVSSYPMMLRNIAGVLTLNCCSGFDISHSPQLSKKPIYKLRQTERTCQCWPRSISNTQPIEFIEHSEAINNRNMIPLE